MLSACECWVSVRVFDECEGAGWESQTSECSSSVL